MSSKFLPKDIAALKDTAIFAGWIAGLLLIAGLVWFFTQPVRNNIVQNAVNHALEQSGDPRRLQAPLPSGNLASGVSRMGLWYDMGGGYRVFVFAFIAEGTFFPAAAVLAPQGIVQEFIPLNNHAGRMFRRISPQILELYSRRIGGQP